MDKNDGAASLVRSDALLGLFVEHRGNECWLEFKSSTKRRASINLTRLALTHDPLVQNAITDWIDDIRWLHGLGPVRPNVALTVSGGRKETNAKQ